MKIELSMPLIKALKLGQKPVGIDSAGKLVFEADPSNAPYILYDASQDAPPGFGVKVAGKKTFIVRRKVNGKSVQPTVGNVADFMRAKSPLTEARQAAAKLVEGILLTGLNPNVEARKALTLIPTLGELFTLYREHVSTKKRKPASEETLRVFDRSVRRFESLGWLKRKVDEFNSEEILREFDKASKEFPVAAEQAFRLAIAALNWKMKNEALDASVAGREVAIRANPFSTLSMNSQFLTREEKELQYQKKGTRNPLTPSKSFGEFLEVAWAKRSTNDNATGVDYLLAMLLWGCRKSEHAPCVWREFVPAGKENEMSYVDLNNDPTWGPHVYFHKTKNTRAHRLPLTPMAAELMRQRQRAGAEESASRGFGLKSRQFVFPARSKQSKTGHYSDSTDLRSAIIEEAGIAKLTNHDLRRSFGAIMTTLHAPEPIKKGFFNHAASSVTEIYTPAEWDMRREWMQKIEQAILMKAPNVYNALKPVEWPPLPAPEPHVCRPPKPRTGRPRKIQPAVEN
ncbi:tyrosine-type recombinase/integrase [Massilia sp. NP310]|uniref:tyrosine-type recombinase/integrase n=1 Tax=Massilia sp. NP310 TaxID=2861282 RepID=UPI001C6346D8|nr:tyrosine-type recombinase/integrase [Massilia sp. NP310]QYG04051.1 integrase family protein [Massilia sp. NP310]